VPGSLLAYTAFALCALVGPGLALSCLLARRIDPALVLPLGTAFTAFSFWLASWLGVPWLFPVLVGATNLMLVHPRFRAPLAEPVPWRALAAPTVALVALLAVTMYGWNRIGPKDEFLLDPMGDQAMHAGLTWELRLPWPPQVPGLAGRTLHYHLGADLVRAAALHWAGIDPFDSISRFEVTLGAIALMLLLRALARRLGAPALAVALAPWTVVATDFAFLLAPFVRFTWWTDLLRGNLLMSLVFDNPVVPALTLALAALLALDRFERGEGRGFLVLAAALALAVPYFKVFMGAHLALGLAVAFLSGPARLRPALLLLAGLTLAGALSLVLSPAGERVEVRFAPLQMAADSFRNLGFDAPSGARLLAWSAFWLPASLGLRLLGLSAAFSSLRGVSAVPAALAAIALSGWPIGLLVSVAVRDYEGHPLPSEAIYLVEQSGAVLWLFAAIGLVAMAARSRRPRLVIAAAALLALPATVEFAVARLSMRPDPVPAGVVRAMRALEAVSRPGDVILQRPMGRRPPPPVILIGRRVPYERFTTYLTQFAPRAELERRHLQVLDFFRAKDVQEARAAARRLGARFLVLYRGHRLRFDSTGLLEPIFEDPEARVFRLVDREG
jgi:hypothetical protein